MKNNNIKWIVSAQQYKPCFFSFFTHWRVFFITFDELLIFLHLLDKPLKNTLLVLALTVKWRALLQRIRALTFHKIIAF